MKDPLSHKWRGYNDQWFRHRWDNRKRAYQKSADRRLNKRTRQAVKVFISQQY